jgi:zinc transporter, ZIP family
VSSAIPLWLVATLWSGLVSLGLLLGAFAGLYAPLKHRDITRAMAAGAGILLAAASLNLVVVAVREAGAIPAGLALVAGGALFSIANFWLAKYGAKHRKRCGECVQQATEKGTPGSGLAIAVGTLLDAVPEAAVLGLETTRIGAPGAALLAAFALGNFAEALSGASGMRIAGRSKGYIFGLWALGALVVTLLAGVAAGFAAAAPPGLESVCNAFAAGALLAMVVETMVPEATQDSAPFNGLIAVLGFLAIMLLQSGA